MWSVVVGELRSVPRPGMLAAVRDRRAVVTGVEPNDREGGRLHLVHLEYAEKARIRQVVIRRLEHELNERTKPPIFCTREQQVAFPPTPVPKESALGEAIARFRKPVRSAIASGAKQRRRAGTFAIEILGKRLLSCPTAFEDSWRRAKEGLAEARTVSEEEVAGEQQP